MDDWGWNRRDNFGERVTDVMFRHCRSKEAVDSLYSMSTKTIALLGLFCRNSCLKRGCNYSHGSERKSAKRNVTIQVLQGLMYWEPVSNELDTLVKECYVLLGRNTLQKQIWLRTMCSWEQVDLYEQETYWKVTEILHLMQPRMHLTRESRGKIHLWQASSRTVSRPSYNQNYHRYSENLSVGFQGLLSTTGLGFSFFLLLQFHIGRISNALKACSLSTLSLIFYSKSLSSK